jgi:hypothetical protein
VRPYLALKPPKPAPPSAIRIERTPERIERGRYLVNHVTDCFGRHGEGRLFALKDFIVPGAEGVGGPLPPRGFAGEVMVPTITPGPKIGIGRWPDGEIIPAIREGIGPDGWDVFPLCPMYTTVRSSTRTRRLWPPILRSLSPVRKPWPPTRIKFPVRLFRNSVPQPGQTRPMRRLTEGI